MQRPLLIRIIPFVLRLNQAIFFQSRYVFAEKPLHYSQGSSIQQYLEAANLTADRGHYYGCG